ncbi:AAA family ATPase [Nocardiopsis flavescens]|uniref:AAA family ATPase n=1 Tax=Nocardiopsis flavescens TaxID=758803 RepID=UPI00364EF8D7
MGIRNFLIEGVSGTGKTTVCDALQRRGHHAVHGDRELAYQGDPETGRPTDGFRHEHHIWNVTKVEALAADHSTPATFFCGGSRNFPGFLHLFDGVFVLDVDLDTLLHRIDQRVRADPTEWGGRPGDRELLTRLHRTQEDVPRGRVIDATVPVEHVVDEILRHALPSEDK